MKYSPLITSFALLLFCTAWSRAQLNVQFDNNTGLGPSDVWITFQNSVGVPFDITYNGGTPVSFGSPTDIMSTPVNLATIGSNGFQVNNATSVAAFVYYGSQPTVTDKVPNFNNSGAGDDYNSVFQPFEITRTGANGDQGNATNINYFAAPIGITSYTGSVAPANQLQQTGYSSSSATVTQQLSAITNSSSEALLKDGSTNLRILGPSTYSATGVGNPYPSFDNYLQEIHTDVQTTNINNSNAFDDNTSTNNFNFTVDLDMTVDASGNINATGTITTTKNGVSDPTGTFNDVNVTISNATSQDQVIYGQAANSIPGDPNNESNVYNGTGWSDMATYLANNNIDAGALGTTQRLAIGDITTGLLGGFVNSDYQVNGMGPMLKDMESHEWWALDPIVAFNEIQSNPDYYNRYSEVIFDATGNTVYSIPFSDRFGAGPLVNTVQFEGQPVDYWVVDLGVPISAVPEPAQTVAIIGGLTLLVAGLRKRLKRS